MKVIAKRGNENIEFSSMKECAAALRVCVQTILKYKKSGEAFEGWLITQGVDAPKVKNRHTRKIHQVVITSPDGVSVMFDTIYSACEKMGMKPAALRNYMAHNCSVFGFKPCRLEDFDGELSVYTPDFFDPLKEVLQTKAQKAKDTRAPKYVGYMDGDFGPIVCPICGAVMAKSSQTTTSRNLPLMHMKKCLEGHTYKIHHSQIFVYD